MSLRSCVTAILAAQLSLMSLVVVAQQDRNRSVANGADALAAIRAINEQAPAPTRSFRYGAATRLEAGITSVTSTENGFRIQLPSRSPVPTPTVYKGRLYVSGGFSSQQYYCFDAQTGEQIWAVELDDDGPSSCVPYDDTILFNCESCTVFSLASETGEMRWSHWLGDPLLSMPAVADGRVFVTYPKSEEGEVEEAQQPHDEPPESAPLRVQPTHIVACFDARDGTVRWQRWIDSDCMTAPVATADELLVTSLTGTVFRFGAADGELRGALAIQATSVPVVIGNAMYLTRRDDQQEAIAECIARRHRTTGREDYAAARRSAPYLDQVVQRRAEYSQKADEFEAPNGIGGGGFGGGFGGGGFGGGGQFSVEDKIDLNRDCQPEETGDGEEDAEEPVAQDALGVTELQAASAVGLGNVSTLQSFQGSRMTYLNRRLYNTMGDQIVATDAGTGKTIWTIRIEGDLKQIGGHLATPPVVAGNFLFVGTVHGNVLQLDPASGKTVKSFPIGASLRFPPILDNGRLYVGTQDGQVVCINTGDRTLTGWPMWGRDPGHQATVIPAGAATR